MFIWLRCIWGLSFNWTDGQSQGKLIDQPRVWNYSHCKQIVLEWHTCTRHPLPRNEAQPLNRLVVGFLHDVALDVCRKKTFENVNNLFVYHGTRLNDEAKWGFWNWTWLEVTWLDEKEKFCEYHRESTQWNEQTTNWHWVCVASSTPNHRHELWTNSFIHGKPLRTWFREPSSICLALCGRSSTNRHFSWAYGVYCSGFKSGRLEGFCENDGFQTNDLVIA